jgi:SAM-dependent MidA family methyltransferase
VNELQQIILSEIRARGPLPFRRFMELALYHPSHGYYERQIGQVGRAGDFFTSVSVGPLFGRLLASRFAQWLGEDESLIHIVETGAHDGQLAADVLGALRANHPDLFARISYLIVEPSKRRKLRQQRQLTELSGKVDWVSGLSELGSKFGGVRGVIYSNELLDAFPVEAHQFDASDRRWYERTVTANGSVLEWCHLGQGGRSAEASVPFLVPLPPELEELLPDGFRIETSSAALDWWQDAAQLLIAGKLLALDYGDTQEGLLAPGRVAGTLRAYRDHQPVEVEDLLNDPGEQDLTAHVNWSAIQTTGESAGLTTEGPDSQGRFLTRVLEESHRSAPDQWQLNPKEIRQFQTLTHPAQLGHRFQAFVQSRGVGGNVGT